LNTDDLADNLTKLINLCESDPNSGLGYIQSLVNDNPQLDSDPYLGICRALAYGNKGVLQALRANFNIDMNIADAEKIRKELGIQEKHLDYLEDAFLEIREIEFFPDFMAKIDTGEKPFVQPRVDAMAIALERCRPGQVQQIWGKTKLRYFGSRRTKISGSIDQKRIEPFLHIFFEFHSIVRSVYLLRQDVDDKGREYIRCILFRGTFDELAPKDIENAGVEGGIYLFDDGTFSTHLPAE